jgi:hypothetical protein
VSHSTEKPSLRRTRGGHGLPYQLICDGIMIWLLTFLGFHLPNPLGNRHSAKEPIAVLYVTGVLVIMRRDKANVKFVLLASLKWFPIDMNKLGTLVITELLKPV